MIPIKKLARPGRVASHKPDLECAPQIVDVLRGVNSCPKIECSGSMRAVSRCANLD